MLVKATPPPANVLVDALVSLMVPVPVTVHPVDGFVLHVEPAIVHTPEPTATVLVDDPPPAKTLELPDKVTFFPLASKVPAVNVSAVTPDKLVLNASTSVTDPPGVLMVNGCVNVAAPALVIVCDPRPANKIVPVPENEHPDPLIQLP